jgi:outer membrane protein assembly factor BamB
MRRKAAFLVVCFVFTGLVLTSQTPTRWRGPNGNGIYPETGLLKKWPADGPQVLWHFTGLGEGHSSPAFANNMIYLSGMARKTGNIYALDMNGKLQWKAPYSEEFHESYPGSRSTPVIAGDLLYIYSGKGVLTAMDSKNGKVRWQKDVIKDFDGTNIKWGVTETVVVDDELVFVTPGGKKNNIIALNRQNGNLVWSSPGKGTSSAYCTPLLVQLPSRKLLVTMTSGHIIGLDAKDGRILWSHPHSNRHEVHANTPIFHNGELFCFSGYGQGGVKLTLSDDGSTVKKAWFNSQLDGRMGGIVLLDGYLYGSGDNNRQWRCVDWKTGEEKYASTEMGKGVVIAADGMLYCYSERGELGLVKATPDGFNLTGKTNVELGSGQHWSHPVIQDGKLYLRHGDALIVYKIK